MRTRSPRPLHGLGVLLIGGVVLSRMIAPSSSSSYTLKRGYVPHNMGTLSSWSDTRLDTELFYIEKLAGDCRGDMNYTFSQRDAYAAIQSEQRRRGGN